MKYESINEFSKRIGKSRRTIFRFYSKNIELNEETKIRNGKKIIPISHNKYWSSEIMYEENKRLNIDIKFMKNLLDYLHTNDKPLANKIWRFDWSYFVTINYKEERSEDFCFKKMHRLYKKLEDKFGKATILRMIFTTEPFEYRDNAHHNHLFLYIQNEKLKKQVLKDVHKFFPNDRIHSDDYDMYKGGIHYIMKDGINGVDWDILGNNLSLEGLKK